MANTGARRHSPEEHAAASAVASLKIAYERTQGRSVHPLDFGPLKKRGRTASISGDDVSSSSGVKKRTSTRGTKTKKSVAIARRELRPYPFFYYRDHSTVEDEDPFAPLTPPGRVPNFPAKMHAILSAPELQDVISWAPHGRAFRVLRPRQFEVRVIPTYFDHSKFSSFVRQANGWGFRRITQGPDRNCYYHEMFLRGMPHLCKKMKRPGASGKPSADPDHEPDLYKISDMLPVSDGTKDTNPAVSLPWTVEGGPKARMPVHMGLLSHLGGNASAAGLTERREAEAVGANNETSPSSGNLKPYLRSLTPLAPKPHADVVSPREDSKLPTAVALSSSHEAVSAPQHPMPRVVPCQPAVAPAPPPQQVPAVQVPSMAKDPLAASQFAAGFAAATALTQGAIQAMVQQAIASMPVMAAPMQQTLPLPQAAVVPAAPVATVPPAPVDQPFSQHHCSVPVLPKDPPSSS